MAIAHQVVCSGPSIAGLLPYSSGHGALQDIRDIMTRIVICINAVCRLTGYN